MGTKDGGYSTAQHSTAQQSKELLATTHDSAGDRGGGGGVGVGVGGDGGSQANANEQSLSVALP